MDVRPLGIPSVLSRLAGNVLQEMIKDDVSAYLGDLQRGFRDPGGCEKITTLVRIARESQERLGVLCLDLTNAFNTVSRKAIRTALLKQPPLHPLLPIFDLYYGGPGQLMYYGDSPSSVPLFWILLRV